MIWWMQMFDQYDLKVFPDEINQCYDDCDLAIRVSSFQNNKNA